jgi:hypothetical protein
VFAKKQRIVTLLLVVTDKKPLWINLSRANPFVARIGSVVEIELTYLDFSFFGQSMLVCVLAGVGYRVSDIAKWLDARREVVA